MLYVLYVLSVPSVRCVINKVLEGLAEGVRGGEGAGVFYLGLDQSSYIALSLLPFQPPQQFFEESLDNRVVFTLFCVQGFIPLPRMFFA